MVKIADKIQKVQLAVGAFCFAVFLISMLIQVFSRLFGYSVAWTEDVCLYPFIWAVMMGASAMLHNDGHFRFDFLEKVLKSKAQAALSLLINALVLAFNILMAYYGTVIAIKFWNFNWVTIPQIKMGYTWLILPISGLCAAFHIATKMIGNVKVLLGKEVSA